MNTNPTLLSKISNTLLIVVSIYFIIYIWTVNSLKRIIPSIFVSSIISIVILAILLYFYKISLKKSVLKTQNSKKIKYIYTQLLLGKDVDIISFYKNIFKDYSNKDNVFFKDDTTIILLYHKASISIEDILPYYKKYNNIKILCLSYDQIIIDYTKKYSLDISILNIEDTCSLYFDSNHIYPDYQINTTKTINYTLILKNILSKNRAKGYFVSGIVILLYTIYIPYKTLYLTLSTILFILCILSIFLNRKNT